MTKPFKVAAIHAAPVFMDTAATIDKACKLIAEAGTREVRFVVFPEVFVPGFPYWINCYPPLMQPGLIKRYHAAALTVPGPEIETIQAAAKEAGVVVALGFTERSSTSSTCYNSQAFIDADGALLGVHRKLQPTFAERYVWGQGDGSTLKVWDSAVGRVGGLACWEHTNNLARHALIVQGIQIHAGAWPALSTMVGFTEVYDPQVDAMMRSHALTGQCFVIVAESPVDQAAMDFLERELGPQEFITAGGGWSSIIHPMGVFVEGPHVGAEEKILAAEIDLDEIEDVKVFVDSAGHYSRSEVLRLVVDSEAKTPEVDASVISAES